MIKEIYGKKIGMTQIFDAEGDLRAVTLLEVEPVCLLEKVNYAGKSKIKIGCFSLGEKKAAKLNKPQGRYFAKLGVGPYKMIREVAPEAEIDASTALSMASTELSRTSNPEQSRRVDFSSGQRQIGVDLFKEGDSISVRAKTKGKGFAGGVKRHGWHGQPKSHGSMTHRRIGSAGSSSFPSRIIKGLHMPGHMGNNFRTMKNLKVFRVDKEKNLLFVTGCVPGSRGTVVAIKKV